MTKDTIFSELKPNDIAQLKNTFINLFRKRQTIQGKKGILSNSGINNSFIDKLNFNLDNNEFGEILISEFKEFPIYSEQPEHHPLLLLLNYILQQPQQTYNLDDNDWKIFNNIHAICKVTYNKFLSENYNKQSLSRKKDIRTSLNKIRQEQSEMPNTLSTNTYDKIDKSIIVDHDLEALVSTLSYELGFRGVFAFSINGHDTLLKEYVIERILRELKNKTNPPCYYRHPINIILHNSISIQSNDLEQEYNICTQLQEENRLNTIIVIWNYDVEKNKIETIVSKFLTKIKIKLQEFLHTDNKCLVIILANVSCQFHINGFISLITPEEFILEGKNGLLEWFNHKLSQSNIQNDDIEQCLNKIKRHNGHLIGTYQEIKNIINELNERIFNNE